MQEVDANTPVSEPVLPPVKAAASSRKLAFKSLSVEALVKMCAAAPLRKDFFLVDFITTRTKSFKYS